MSAMGLADLVLESDPSLPDFFLGHLASLVARQAATMSSIERTALGIAAFSVFLDCLDLGLGEQAHAIMGQLRDELVTAERLVA